MGPNAELESSTEAMPLHEPRKNRSRLRVTAVLVSLFSTLFISALNVTIVATTIPTITADLHSAAGYSWIGGAFTLGNTAFLAVWAKLSDIWGRKPILLTLVALYFCSSIICATSKSIGMLIAGRALQGMTCGGITPLVMITISDIFSMRQRALYLGFLQAIWAVAGGVGPVLGGALTQYISWRWIFWINLPVAGTSFILLLLFLDVHNPRTPFMEGIKAVDWFGSIAIIGALSMPLLGLNFGGELFPWNSPRVICLIVSGCAMLGIFVFSQARLSKYPLMPLKLFQRKSNVACVVIGFTQLFGVQAAEFYLPLFFQSIWEASPTRSGVLILPMTITESVTGIICGLIIHRTGRYIEIIRAGTVLFALGIGLHIHFSETSSLAEIAGIETIAGISAGMLFDPPLLALQAMVSQDDTATATATFNLHQNIGSFMATVLGGVLFQNGMRMRTQALKNAGLPETVVEQLSGDAAAANVDVIKTLSDLTQKLVVKRAFASSLRYIWILATCLAVCGAFASLLISKQVLNTEHVETETGIKKNEPVIAELPRLQATN
ncbi:MFS general substrate transporter [Trichophyton interdigitale]|uniref:MFS general substrate transporter n=1 Tax=Trichophyton interdigitale TaxID=101480 RepID=A0A9P4YPS1_9EURO|nr:MFS general substrate transporter [Trichophyton interdigitale]KAF3900863.1 MFS general substrate transporter [Trichophyton interdigitale]KAG8211826.1 MFS general substrate transporter [Trichophyton interdigitale]